jgi:uncharacterized membrane protein YgcG
MSANCCCCGPLENQSCGWPAGTVRAVIALVTIILSFAAAISIMIMLIVYNQYAIAVGINSSIWGIVGGIIGYYFGTRQANEATESIIRARDETLRLVSAAAPRTIIRRSRSASSTKSKYSGGGDRSASGGGNPPGGGGPSGLREVVIA